VEGEGNSVGTLGSQDLKDMAWEDFRLLPPVPPPPLRPPPPSRLQCGCVFGGLIILLAVRNTCDSDESTCSHVLNISMIEHDAIMITALKLHCVDHDQGFAH
jgi:hypothetical protein